jgi:large subunit ribosomal protein L10
MMTKAEKKALIEALSDKFSSTNFFYITDYSTMSVADMNAFRRKCFENGVEYKAIKNKLIQKALGNVDETAYQELFDTLKGSSAIMFADEAKLPGVVLKEFRKDNDLPLLKSAYIDSAVYVGDDQIDTLAKLKSKSDLIGEVVTLLQSPMARLLGQLNSGGNTIQALLKGIEDHKGEGAEA